MVIDVCDTEGVVDVTWFDSLSSLGVFGHFIHIKKTNFSIHYYITHSTVEVMYSHLTLFDYSVIILSVLIKLSITFVGDFYELSKTIEILMKFN